ncbi:uncharacterized protein LOC111276652 [Durio zibethinus]|uniref:Uncharacterized protein LOC111276652 n=1 Tax=Durio zibethinus TaxID=66656 RepID=A0A6P5WR07_DURZI|nr:uncharacterized protein LOC111276652 [Durio zibethinus]
MKSPLAIGKKPSRSSKRGHKKKLKMRIGRLRKKIEEISEYQKGIKQGQRQLKEKFEIIESECEQLQKETGFIIQQCASTQIRIALMFQILNARQNNDFTKASQLTQALRELIVEQKNLDASASTY